MSNATLRNELSNDPLDRGYSSMTPVAVADDLNTTYRTREKSAVTGSELWNRTNPAEFSALSDAAKDQWLALCAIDSVDPFGPAESVATDIFSAGSDTHTALGEFRTEDITRGDELGLDLVRAYDVAKAREQLEGN